MSHDGQCYVCRREEYDAQIAEARTAFGKFHPSELLDLVHEGTVQLRELADVHDTHVNAETVALAAVVLHDALAEAEKATYDELVDVPGAGPKRVADLTRSECYAIADRADRSLRLAQARMDALPHEDEP